jgi:N-acetylglucosamine kinase-like BadF-type ATPase
LARRRRRTDQNFLLSLDNLALVSCQNDQVSELAQGIDEAAIDAWVVALDVGGSGSRLVAEFGNSVSPERISLNGRAVKVNHHGSDAPAVVASLCQSFNAWAARMGHAGMSDGSTAPVASAAVGITGLTSLVDKPGDVHDILARELRTNRTAVAGDALTAHLGALSGRAGAVLSVGTGAVAFGYDGVSRWRRADGWGHLLGDLGAGVWVGGEALRAAGRYHDGASRGASKRLLDAAVAKFGLIESWPNQFYKNAERARQLASMAPEVIIAAAEGDPTSINILEQAGRHLADTLSSALGRGIPPLASTTGRLVQEESPLTVSLTKTLSEDRPEVSLVPSAGSPLDGALTLARRLREAPQSVAGFRPWLTVRVDGHHTLPESTEDVGAAETLTAELSATELPGDDRL